TTIRESAFKIGIPFALVWAHMGRRERPDEDPSKTEPPTQEARRLAMKNLIVAGILGTMLTLTNGARTANAFDGREYHRPIVHGPIRYGDRFVEHIGRYDSCNRFDCGTTGHYVRPVYETGYHYRPLLTTYHYDRELHVAPRLAYHGRW